MDETITDKLMFIHNDDVENYHFCRLFFGAQLNEPANKNSIKVPEVVKPTNKKTPC